MLLTGPTPPLPHRARSFRQDLTDLNRFLSANEIPSALRYQLREYMHQSVALRRAATGNRLLVGLAPKLRNEVALQINEKWLHKIDLISDECEEGLILELAFALTLQIFPPGDVCPVGSIYIVSTTAISRDLPRPLAASLASYDLPRPPMISVIFFSSRDPFAPTSLSFTAPMPSLPGEPRRRALRRPRVPLGPVMG